MSRDDDERAIETKRLVDEMAEVRRRMKMRAEQPLRSGGSGAYRAINSVSLMTAAVKAAEAKSETDAPSAADETPPPSRRRT